MNMTFGKFIRLGFSMWMVAGLGEAATLRVPQQYPTIQQAVDAAVAGDIVRVAAGVYSEPVLIVDKAVSLIGAGAETTILDGGAVDRPVTVSNSGESRVTIAGFTIRNGQTFFGEAEIGSGRGGGLFAEFANITVRDNVLSGNHGCLGTALGTFQAAITLLRNRIENNSGTTDCGQQAISIHGPPAAGESLVAGNVIRNQNVTGLDLYVAGTVTVSNNIFSHNQATELGVEYGGFLSVSTTVTLVNNLFSANAALGAGGAGLFSDSLAGVSQVSGNSFVGNTGVMGASALYLSGFDPAKVVVRANRFDEGSDMQVITCAGGLGIERTNVFAENFEGTTSCGIE